MHLQQLMNQMSRTFTENRLLLQFKISWISCVPTEAYSGWGVIPPCFLLRWHLQLPAWPTHSSPHPPLACCGTSVPVPSVAGPPRTTPFLWEGNNMSIQPVCSSAKGRTHQFCSVLAFTHQVEILWSGNRDAEQITDVTLISCPVPAAGAISTGGATGGVPAPHLREHVPFQHLNGALMPKGTHFTRLPFCQLHFWCSMCCWSQRYIIPLSKDDNKTKCCLPRPGFAGSPKACRTGHHWKPHCMSSSSLSSEADFDSQSLK